MNDIERDECPMHGAVEVASSYASRGSDPYNINRLACGHDVACFGPGESNITVGNYWGRHFFNSDLDRCNCGAEWVYHEDIEEPGYGCESTGLAAVPAVDGMGRRI